MNKEGYNTTFKSSNIASLSSQDHKTTISTHRRSESTSFDSFTDSQVSSTTHTQTTAKSTDFSSNLISKTSDYSVQSLINSNKTLTEVILSVESTSQSSQANSISTLLNSGTTILLSNAIYNSSLTEITASTVTTHTVTNIFSDIQTVTLMNDSQVTTQTLPNSMVTTKTLSEQIMTLGVPIATLTSTFTGEDQGTTLTTPLFLSSTTIFPNYDFTYTQFFIITQNSSEASVQKKREVQTASTIMEILINVSKQPATQTITTDTEYYSKYIKNKISTENMVVLKNFTNSVTSSHRNLGAIIGGTVGGVFGILLISLIFFKWYAQKFNYNDGDEEEEKTTINPVNDGFSHHSGRRINIFEENELLEYYGTSKTSNPLMKLLEKLHLRNSNKGNKNIDPFNDEFDFKNRQIQAPDIVEKSARDILNESNPFNDVNETSQLASEYFGNMTDNSYDSRAMYDLTETSLDYDIISRTIESRNNIGIDHDDISLIGDTVSMSSLCPNADVKANGMLKELF
ncbi:hypothetical protein QEN19_000750 [Hanseniaspora menglaensis]